MWTALDRRRRAVSDAEHARLTGDGFEARLKVLPESEFRLRRGFRWVHSAPDIR